MVEFNDEDIGERGRVSRDDTSSGYEVAALESVALPSTAGDTVDLSAELADNHLVLVCYPGDREGLEYPELMGCTPQACSVRDTMARIDALDATVYGVNFHSTERQREFVDREDLNYELLSDEDETLATALQLPVWVSDSGERFLARRTLVLAKGGEEMAVIEDPSTERHGQEIVDVLESLSGQE